jgi:hypothetical protein
MKPMEKFYSAEEVRNQLLNHMKGLCQYWSTPPTVPLHKAEFPTERSRMEGLCFSILVALDGGSSLPGIDLVLNPHPEDKAYHIGLGKKYYKKGMVINDCQLHEHFH